VQCSEQYPPPRRRGSRTSPASRPPAAPSGGGNEKEKDEKEKDEKEKDEKEEDEKEEDEKEKDENLPGPLGRGQQLADRLPEHGAEGGQVPVAGDLQLQQRLHVFVYLQPSVFVYLRDLSDGGQHSLLDPGPGGEEVGQGGGPPGHWLDLLHHTGI
jgi:hypothetical protein